MANEQVLAVNTAAEFNLDNVDQTSQSAQKRMTRGELWALNAKAANDSGAKPVEVAPRVVYSSLTAMLAVLLASLQLVDGWFTFMGVLRFGYEAEANPLLKSLMMTFGLDVTLLVTKLIAILVIYGMFRASLTVRWVPIAFALISCCYIYFSVIPWSVLLFG